MARLLNLIEKHTVLWELKRRLADLGQRPGRCLANGVAYGPCLLVSRERGSGGSAIARLAGERLGWQVFDREILDQIAHLAHVRLQLIGSVDEQTRSKLEGNWQPDLKPEDIGYETYLRYLRQVVLTLGHHGDVVMVGRGAQYLLPSQCALRVRVVSPLELRVHRVAEEAKLPEAQAQAEVEKFDAERASFVRICFGREASSPLNYDLVLNTGELSIKAAAGIVLLGLRDKLALAPPNRGSVGS
jgi:hypothetical protein